MKKTAHGSILLVDDDELICDLLHIKLDEAGYSVVTANNALQALGILEKQSFDVVLSDINMPDMKGYDLIAKINTLYPPIRTALITAYNVEDYIHMAREFNISNIITKSTPFNYDEFFVVVAGLVTRDIFGLARYMLPEYSKVSEYTIRNSSQIVHVEEAIMKDIDMFGKSSFDVQLQLEEIITNAVYHAPVDAQGRKKYQKHANVELQEHELVKIVLGKDDEKYGISVTDTSGQLTRERVLYQIDRHIAGEGLLDTSGRGLHMSRMFADRMIVNIKKGATTEVVLINYLTKKYRGSKPLYINEV